MFQLSSSGLKLFVQLAVFRKARPLFRHTVHVEIHFLAVLNIFLSSTLFPQT